MDLKYPRTYHLPNSEGLTQDDRKLPGLDCFRGQRVIVTEKMDGEGTTLTRERTYPRSVDGRSHPSRDWIKAHHARKAFEIPENWRISGEYLYARHSIAYRRDHANALDSYFYGFGVWDEHNELIDWDETLDCFALLNIVPVPILYDGPWFDALPGEMAQGLDTMVQEGFVIRLAARIAYPSGQGAQGRFLQSVAKWVRADHVQSDEHWASNWRDAPDYRNELKDGISPEP